MSGARLNEGSVVAKRTEPVYVQGGIKRTLLQEVDFPDGSTINTSIIEVQARTNATPHTHPGVEIGYVLEGEFDLAIEGRPDQNLKVGSSYAIPADAVHYAKVRGDETLKVLCFFVIDKTRPLASLENSAS
jgi:quercetin dioxygenase-like cupin family protein